MRRVSIHCGAAAGEIETNLDTVSQVVSRKCFRGGVTDTPVSDIAARKPVIAGLGLPTSHSWQISGPPREVRGSKATASIAGKSYRVTSIRASGCHDEVQSMKRQTEMTTTVFGSRHLLQAAVNCRPELLLSAMRRSGAVGRREQLWWVSPLENDGYREYRDAAALSRLELIHTVMGLPADLARFSVHHAFLDAKQLSDSDSRRHG